MSEDLREAFYHGRVRKCGPHYTGFDLTSIETVLNLVYTYDVLQQIIGRYLAGFGLSKSALNVMMVLRCGEPEGMLLHDLGELLLVSRANVTGLIDSLQEKGYVKRVVDAGDRRGRFARLTRKGEEILDQVMPVHFRNVSQLMSDLSMDERNLLTSLLKKMRRSLVAHASGPAEYGARHQQTL
ncbi:MAG: MarR family transcriptional regulator [Acidobacteriaceae bacterium]|nr:MarR family transcriptional regulator [Acidobacteriaceae bacterium]